METSNQSIRNFNELVFENRNKEYGAYAIRQGYSDTVTRSLFITIAFFSGLVLLGILFTNTTKKVDTTTANVAPVLGTIEVEVNLPKPKQPEKLAPEPKQPEPPKTQTLNAIVTDKPTEQTLKPNETATVAKVDNDKGVDSVAKHELTIAPTVKPAIEDPNTIKIIVDEMPDFKNLPDFLGSHLKYPPMALEGGISGTVVVSFVVETDGAIDDIKVLKPLGGGCTEEAVRVVKLMPKWKPGKNQGHAVRVAFNLPIRFTLK